MFRTTHPAARGGAQHKKQQHWERQDAALRASQEEIALLRTITIPIGWRCSSSEGLRVSFFMDMDDARPVEERSRAERH